MEIWEPEGDRFFRIYHSEKLLEELKAQLDSLEGFFRSTRYYSDFRGNISSSCQKLYEILSSNTMKELAAKNPILTRNSDYEGLSLPDVDVSDAIVLVDRLIGGNSLLLARILPLRMN